MAITWNVSLYVLIADRKWRRKWISGIVLNIFHVYFDNWWKRFFVSHSRYFGEPQKSFYYSSDKLFMRFEMKDKDHISDLCDINPDLHFYQEFNQANVKYNYYLETKINDEMSEPNGKKNVLSLCHANVKSARKILTILKIIWIY